MALIDHGNLKRGYDTGRYIFLGAVPHFASGEEKNYNLSAGFSYPDEKEALNLRRPTDGIFANNFIFKGQEIIGYGTEAAGSSFNAALTQSGASIIYDVCRGMDLRPVGKYNFYQEFYPFSFFHSQQGYVQTLREVASFPSQPTINYGGCRILGVGDQNERWGILSTQKRTDRAYQDFDVNSWQMVADSYRDCPPTAASLALSEYTFNEVSLRYTAGTFTGGIAGGPYNNAPIPNSLDYREKTVDFKYQTYTNQENVGGINVTLEYIAGTTGSLSGDPFSGLGIATKTQEILGGGGLLSNEICPAIPIEQTVSASLLPYGRHENYGNLNVQPTVYSTSASNSTSTYNAASNTPSFVTEPLHLWAFSFYENQDTVPFAGLSEGTLRSKSPQSDISKTKLFNRKYASIDHWWENRQCPENVDFLPHTVGGAIMACPRNYLESPYYATKGDFGYFGTRFISVCNTLKRDKRHNLSEGYGSKYGGVGSDGIPVMEADYPTGTSAGIHLINVAGSSSEFTETYRENSYEDFDSVLLISKIEKQYSDWTAGNEGWFLYKNYDQFKNSSEYLDLVGTSSSRTENQVKIHSYFSSLFSSFDQSERRIVGILEEYFVGEDYRIDYSRYANKYNYISSFFLRDELWDVAKPKIQENLVTDSDHDMHRSFFRLLSDWGRMVTKNGVSPDQDFYEENISGIKERITTRNMHSLAYGGVIDLYPYNEIYYSTDNSHDYSSGNSWASCAFSAASASASGINRRYFKTAFSKKSDLTGITNLASSLTNGVYANNISGYRPGSFLNEKCSSFSSPRDFFVSSGTGVGGRTIDNWWTLGYKGVGEIRGDYSCFTPIFIQNPVSETCKLGQPPTLIAEALDYHTLPEDKVGAGYKEVDYWASRLKLVDVESGSIKQAYRLKYKWGRVKKENISVLLNGEYMKESASENFISDLENKVEWANTTGFGIDGVRTGWSCLENNSFGINGVWSSAGKYAEGNSVTCTLCEDPSKNISIGGQIGGIFGAGNQDYGYEAYDFVQGSTKDTDDYYYFVVASGRFGFRASDPCEINVETKTSFDISALNLGNASMELGLTIQGPDGSTTAFSTPIPSYMLNDSSAVLESETRKRKYRNFTDGAPSWATAFNGLEGYSAPLTSWSPETIDDIRGNYSTQGRLTSYGALFNFEINLEESTSGPGVGKNIGEMLYGRNSLPRVSNYETAVEGNKVTLSVFGDGLGYEIYDVGANEKPVLGTWSNISVLVKDLEHVGMLYPPSNKYNNRNFAGTAWQFDNNLGTIKRYGYKEFESFIQDQQDFGNPTAPADPSLYSAKTYLREYEIYKGALEDAKNLFGSTTIAGEQAGWHDSKGLSRRMLYFVEPFESYYALCTSLARVINTTFIAPGLRGGTSSIQYAWFGQPNSPKSVRKSMYGPYAYQWKTLRNNRDRHGNGMPLSFYSYSTETNYSLMYDAAAFYGLYLRDVESIENDVELRKNVDEIRVLREAAALAWGFNGTSRNQWFGYYPHGDYNVVGCGSVYAGRPPTYTNQEDLIERDIIDGNSATDIFAGYDRSSILCSYTEGLGDSFRLKYFNNTKAHIYCSEEDEKAGRCFNPCLSFRNQMGFMPGGKKLDGMSLLHKGKITHLTSDATSISQYNSLYNGLDINLGVQTTAYENKELNLFHQARGPINNPYSTRMISNLTSSVTIPFVSPKEGETFAFKSSNQDLVGSFVSPPDSDLWTSNGYRDVELQFYATEKMTIKDIQIFLFPRDETFKYGIFENQQGVSPIYVLHDSDVVVSDWVDQNWEYTINKDEILKFFINGKNRFYDGSVISKDLKFEIRIRYEDSTGRTKAVSQQADRESTAGLSSENYNVEKSDLQILKDLSLGPCSYGSDHCNYITPIVRLESSTLRAIVNPINQAANQTANIL